MGIKHWDDPKLYISQNRSSYANYERSFRVHSGAFFKTHSSPTASVNVMLGMGLLPPADRKSWQPLPEDLLFMYLNNPANVELWRLRPDLGANSLAGSRIPEFYPKALSELFGVKATCLSGLSFQDVAIEIVRGCGVQMMLKDPEADLSVVAYDDESQELIAMESIERPWPDHSGFVRRIGKKNFAAMAQGRFLVFSYEHKA